MGKYGKYCDDTAAAALRDRYRVLDLVGRGGMGTVYEVDDLVSGERIALKKLHSVHLDNADILGRFKREVSLLRTLSHPGICPVLHAGIAGDGTPYYTMPLLAGRDLAAMISREGAKTPKDAARIVSAVLDALAYAHERKVQHRDIKPGNVFVCDTMSDGVKLLDFGISKCARDGADITTATGAVLGTPHYMSPEQARGAKYVDCRTDLFSVGVVLYEMLTGRRPFEGSGYNEVIIKLVSEPFVPPSQFNSELPRAVENVVLKAMSRHPDDRYDSATEMRDALWNAVSARSFTSYAGDPPENTTAHDGDRRDSIFAVEAVLSPVLQRKKAGIFAGVSVAIVAAVLLFGALFFGSRHSSPRPTVGSDVSVSSKVSVSAVQAPIELPSDSVSCVSPSAAEVSPSPETKVQYQPHAEAQKVRTAKAGKPRRVRKASPSAESSSSAQTVPQTVSNESEPIVGRLGTRIVTTF